MKTAKPPFRPSWHAPACLRAKIPLACRSGVVKANALLYVARRLVRRRSDTLAGEDSREPARDAQDLERLLVSRQEIHRSGGFRVVAYHSDKSPSIVLIASAFCFQIPLVSARLLPISISGSNLRCHAPASSKRSSSRPNRKPRMSSSTTPSCRGFHLRVTPPGKRVFLSTIERRARGLSSDDTRSATIPKSA